MQTSKRKHSGQAIVRLACIGRSDEGVDRMVDSWAETSRYFGGRDWWIQWCTGTVGRRLVDSWAETGG